MSQAQYDNFKQFLLKQDLILLPTPEEYYKDKKVIFKCSHGHTRTLTYKGFMKKMNKTKKDPNLLLCTKCQNDENIIGKFEELETKVQETSGHKLLSVTRERKITYECKECGSVRESSLGSIFSNKGRCPDCKYTPSENNVEKAKKQVEAAGYELVSYTNYYRVEIKCPKGHIYTSSLQTIKHGGSCSQCDPESTNKAERIKKTSLERYGVEHFFKSEQVKAKIKKTNLERYGVEYASQSEEIKEKIKENCLAKRGVSHHMKLPEIREKGQATMIKRYGIKFAFHSEECFKKIRATCLERYGVECILQSSFIQAKIRQTFMAKIGAPYPMSNQDHWKKMLMAKYGVDNFSKTSEYGIKYKATCMARYGVDNPIQNPEIFSKAMKSSFSKKEYVFPNRRKAYVMGYEPACITTLLNKYKEDDIIVETENIPVIFYNKLKKNKTTGEAYEEMGAYYPDILLPNKLVEVKSEYTYQLDPENNERKFRECARLGYELELWIYRNEKTLAIIRTYTKGVIFTDYDIDDPNYH